MGDPNENKSKAGVPSWQLKPSDTASEVKPEAQDTAPQTVPDRGALIEKARKFLQEDEVRNASTDKQVLFLEGKGLKRDEIEELLGVTRNIEATHPESEVRAIYISQPQTVADLHGVNPITEHSPATSNDKITFPTAGPL